MAETRINTECFLPVREGVSRISNPGTTARRFPPCTGGCIVDLIVKVDRMEASSLYGRVYRYLSCPRYDHQSFLPVREGVSLKLELVGKQFKFPPCMGGCIVDCKISSSSGVVSSLHGRVYRRL